MQKSSLTEPPPMPSNYLSLPLDAFRDRFAECVADVTAPYWLNVLTVGLGQLGAVLLLGVPLYYGLRKAARRGLPVGRPGRPANEPTKNALR